MVVLRNLIFLGWLVFWLYWLISASTAKRNVRFGNHHFIAYRLVIFALLVILINDSTVRHSDFANHLLAHGNDLVAAIGFILFLVGLAFAIWARRHLGKNWGIPMSLKQDPELVTSGPYHWVRHPIYSGILLATLGAGLVIGIYWFIILIFVATYFIYSATVEEKIMTKQFPATYPDYKKHSKMLIPFIF